MDALDWGPPILESAITLIAGGRCFYRGRDLEDLAQLPFEHVAEWLWVERPLEEESSGARASDWRLSPALPRQA